MIKKISNIIEGWINRFRKVHPAKESLFRDRLEICQSNECGMLKLGMCTACGCPVKSKVRSVDEECPENMWNPVLYADEDGREFISEYDLPSEVRIEFVKWLLYKSDDVGFKLNDYEWVYGWGTWLEFKEYLRGF